MTLLNSVKTGQEQAIDQWSSICLLEDIAPDTGVCALYQGEQVALFERVLLIQAEQSLRSAESGYAAGKLNSLDLLDAERVLLDVRTGIERVRADHAIAHARLEGAIGAPLDEMEGASS